MARSAGNIYKGRTKGADGTGAFAITRSSRRANATPSASASMT
jgi:hypothetical protein